MKQAIRGLGWATTVLWILVILFSGTVVYSAMHIGMSFEEEPQVTVSNGEMTLSIPFSISNGGLYDISELNITTSIGVKNGTEISRSTSLVSLIRRESTVNEAHNISVSVDDILVKDLTYLLFNDTDFSVDIIVGLTYAHVIPLRVSSNLSMSWGAPLYNLMLGGVSIVPPNQVSVSLSFENHAFFGIDGTIRLEIVDAGGSQIGSGTEDISVPSGSSYDDSIFATVTGDPRDVAEVRLYFETSLFSFGPVVMPLE